jgi:hypothetical protein
VFELLLSSPYLGAVVFVIYDNSRSDPETANTAMYTVPKAGDTATLNNNTIACPTAADALKIKGLLRTFTDRQPAAIYSLEHGCSVLTKSKSYTIRAYSARHAAVSGGSQSKAVLLDNH